MTNFKPYLLQCITNLHVGSGDANYGIIDKLVQRDPVTSYPTIHASSMKGALREHFEKKEGWGKNDPRIHEIFGKEGRDGKESESGNYKFLSADILALPVRCSYKQFLLTFDSEIIKINNAKAKMLISANIFKTESAFHSNRIYTNDSINSPVYCEDYALTKNDFLPPLEFSNGNFDGLNERFATLANGDFMETIKKLPVIARNNIEDGTSKNLWYEEVVPHQTVFITYIGSSKNQADFDTVLLNDIVQIGANATVGYGLCKFFELQ